MASIRMECYEQLTIDKTKHEIRPWIDDPRLKINFNFSIQTRLRNYYWMTPYLGTRPVLIQGLPNRDLDDFVFDGAVFAAPFSDGDVREAVGRAVKGSSLDHWPCVVERALKEVREWCPQGKLRGRVILDLDFKVVIEHVHVYYREAGDYDYPRMIPAADSALRMLEKCEVSGGATAERCCCICLEELGGEEEAASMPCKHIFHGGCIKEWLRTSHYCPLCRYEMPTE